MSSLKSVLDCIVRDIIEKLNYGYKENIYQKAICYKLQDIGYKIEREVVRDVIYEKYILGSVRADMIVNNEYIIEMKSISKIGEKEINQLKRYLNIFNKSSGFLINISYKDYEIVEVLGEERFDPVSY